MEASFDIGNLAIQGAIYLFVALFIGLSQAAGIGGGPILNICLMIGLGYSAKESMAITYIFLLGGTVASIYSNYGKRNKEDTRNLLDENLVVITLPMTVAGSVAGAIFNHFISELLITIAFTGLLLYLAANSWQKYRVFSEMERQKALLGDRESAVVEIELQDMDSEGEPKRPNEELEGMLNHERIPFRMENMSIFLQILVLSILALLLKGGSTFSSIAGFEPCGGMSQLCVLALIVGAYFYAKFILKKQYALDDRKEELGYVFHREEDKMSIKYFRSALYGGFAAGCTGGMLGIGGAIILVPYWLEIGLDKDIAASSSAPLVFSSAFISMFIAAMCGMYSSIGQVVFHFFLAFMASYYVKKMVNWVKVACKMEAIIFILLVVVMVLSVAFLLPYEIMKMLDHPAAFFAFGHLC